MPLLVQCDQVTGRLLAAGRLPAEDFLEDPGELIQLLTQLMEDAGGCPPPRA